MKKLIFALLLTGLVVPVSAAAAGAKSAAKLKSEPAAQGEQVLLRETASVNSRLVRLGDIFAGVGDKADITVAYAPEPGKRAIFDSRWLYRAARAYGLNWRPLSLQDQVVVERESLAVNREEIEDRIRVALIDRGADTDIQVELSNRMMQIYVPGDATATINVEDVNDLVESVVAGKDAGQAVFDLPIYNSPLPYPNLLNLVESQAFAPFRRIGQRLLHGGKLNKGQVQAWALNRYCYQSGVPRKDAALMSRVHDRELRREWVHRILDHDGASAEEGGIERWLVLTDALVTQALRREKTAKREAKAREQKEVTTMFGRRRPLPDIDSTNAMQRIAAELPPQGVKRLNISAKNRAYPRQLCRGRDRAGLGGESAHSDFR